MADFNDSPVEGIAADRPVNPGAQAIEQNFDDLKRKRLAQAHKFRSVTFYTILGLVVIMIVTSVAALVHELFRKGGPSNVVIVAFISGATIQVIGLLAIVTHYLFPREEPEKV